MLGKYRDAYPLNTRWQVAANIPVRREPPDDLLWDEMAAPEVTDEEANELWEAHRAEDAKRRGVVLVHERCQFCGRNSQHRHPAGVVARRWFCGDCGRFQNDARGELVW